MHKLFLSPAEMAISFRCTRHRSTPMVAETEPRDVSHVTSFACFQRFTSAGGRPNGHFVPYFSLRCPGWPKHAQLVYSRWLLDTIRVMHGIWPSFEAMPKNQQLESIELATLKDGRWFAWTKFSFSIDWSETSPFCGQTEEYKQIRGGNIELLLRGEKGSWWSLAYGAKLSEEILSRSPARRSYLEMELTVRRLRSTLLVAVGLGMMVFRPIPVLAGKSIFFLFKLLIDRDWVLG